MYARITKNEQRIPATSLSEKVDPKKKLEEPSLSRLIKDSEPKKIINEKVENQTIYYNIRKKQFENRDRKQNYFKEEQPAFLKSDDIQQKIYQYSTVESILRLYNGHKFTYSTKNLVTTIHRLGKYLPIEKRNHKKEQKQMKRAFAYKTSEKRIQSLFFTLYQNFEMFTPTEKVIILWSISRMNFFDTDLFHKALENILKILDVLSLDQCCLVAWCLSKSKSRSPKFYGLISLEIEKRISKPEFLDSFHSKLGDIKQENLVDDSKYLSDSDEEVIGLMDLKPESSPVDKLQSIRKEKSSPQSLSILFWSFAKKDVQDATLFSALAAIFFKKISEYNLHSIALNMYALSTTKIKVQQSDLDLIEERLLKINLEDEKSLTLKTILVLLEKVYFIFLFNSKMGFSNNRGIYDKYLDDFLKKNPYNLSPRFSTEILRVMASKNLFHEDRISKLFKIIRKSVKDFNLEDCLSGFESICRNQKHFKDEDSKKTLEMILLKLEMFENDIGFKERKIIEKIANDSKFSHKIITKLLQLKIGNK